MNNNIEFSQPANIDTPDIYVDWNNDGRGHYAAGPYYIGYNAMVERKHSSNGDGQQTFTITVQDRAGNSYSTTWTIRWMADRDLGLTANGLDKQVVGDNTVFTAHVLFHPSANFGNPSIHLYADGELAYSTKRPCDVSETDTTFTYAGQTGYDLTCVASNSNLNSFAGDFTLYIDATAQYPPMNPPFWSVVFPISP